jgi:hypothetical protein
MTSLISHISNFVLRVVAYPRFCFGAISMLYTATVELLRMARELRAQFLLAAPPCWLCQVIFYPTSILNAYSEPFVFYMFWKYVNRLRDDYHKSSFNTFNKEWPDLTVICDRLFGKYGNLNFSKLYGSPRPVKNVALTFYFLTILNEGTTFRNKLWVFSLLYTARSYRQIFNSWFLNFILLYF